MQIFFKLALAELISMSTIKCSNKNVNKQQQKLNKCGFKTKEAAILFCLTSGNNANWIFISS